MKNLPTVTICADPYDNYLLAMATAGTAEFLVTGDKRDLLSLKAARRHQDRHRARVSDLKQAAAMNDRARLSAVLWASSVFASMAQPTS
jgi:predicted nucleic acid-binding protein